MKRHLRIGTRDSELAMWQATLVQDLLNKNGISSELVYIKSEGDIDTVTPLYQLGVQGVFTRSLDAALLSKRIDIVVHSMKDVPTQLAQGIQQAAVLKRGSHKDIFVAHPEAPFRLPPVGEATNTQPSVFGETNTNKGSAIIEALQCGEALPSGGLGWAIATSSIRRIAQWLYRYPGHRIENLRGNVNTRLQKLKESNWNGAIFAAAGLERINLRPGNSIELDWMLPAPAQGAIMVVCRANDPFACEACHQFNDPISALCTKIERDFLSRLMGGCSTPISALAVMSYAQIIFKGNICAPDGSKKIEIEQVANISEANDLGIAVAEKIVLNGGQEIVDSIRKTGLTTDAEA
ncbi:MAG: hydroxymethylbilane synthase [Chitinophagaceae bacterium]